MLPRPGLRAQLETIDAISARLPPPSGGLMGVKAGECLKRKSSAGGALKKDIEDGAAS